MLTKTFKIRRSNISLYSLMFIPVFIGAVVGLCFYVKEGRHIYLNSQLTMLFIMVLLLFILYGVIYAIFFKIEVSEETISVTNPYVFWQDNKRRVLKWDEIGKVEMGYSLLSQTRPLILKARIEIKKKHVMIPSVINNYPELMGIILKKVSPQIDGNVRKGIESQIQQNVRKWPLSIGWTIAFGFLVTVVAIYSLMVFLVGRINYEPSHFKTVQTGSVRRDAESTRHQLRGQA